MAEETNPKKPLMAAAETAKFSSSSRVCYIVLEFSSLSMASVLLLATIVINILASLDNADEFGFKNSTGHISDNYTTQITPDGWTFSILSLIYIWQGLWIIYAWSFAFRPLRPRTVPWTTYLLHALSSLLNITWVYLWGNGYPQVAFPFIFFTAITLYAAVGLAAINLFRQSPKLRAYQGSHRQIELVIANVLVINGIAIYATWLTIATLANFSIVLQYFADLGEVATGTLMLCILSIEVLAYFVLENTVLDRFARYVFIVYPVIVFVIGGILSKQWDLEEKQNPIFALVLEVIVSVLLIARIILWVLFYFFRPLRTHSVGIDVIF